MNNTLNPFGCTYLNLNVVLCKMGKTSQMMFNFYVACRSEIKDWEYNAPDIVEQTGMTKKTVLGYCRAMEKAELFIKSGITSTGATKYKLDKAKFKQHLQGDTPLEPIFAKAFQNKDKNRSEGVLTPPSPSGSEDSLIGVLTPSDGGSEDSLGGVLRTNKDIIVDERENERHTPKMACVSAFHNLSEDDHNESDAISCQVEAAPRSDLASQVAAIRKDKRLPDHITDAEIIRYIRRKESEALRQKQEEEAVKLKKKIQLLGYTKYEEKQIFSPLEHNEHEANISPADKVTCLKAAIDCNNQNGFLNYSTGNNWYSSIIVPKHSLELALQFFTLNPTCTVSDVLGTLESCCRIKRFFEKPSKGTYAEYFHAWKGGESLQYFFVNLSNVIANLESMKYPSMHFQARPCGVSSTGHENECMEQAYAE